MRFQIVGLTIGILLLMIGMALLVPAVVDFSTGHPNARVFLRCAALSYFFGGILYLGFRDTAGPMTLRQAFLLTVVSWLVFGVFSALPLCFSDLKLSAADAFFESVSGITTTGSTILVGLDDMSYGILLWRALIQWIGGIGVVAFAIVFLPFLRVGGMQLFQMESSDRSDKVLPHTADTVLSLVKVYCVLTVICFAVYRALGMSAFDAVTHAMTTLSTGGYSTHDASFGFFNSYALDMAASFFMLLGGLPFILYVKALHGRGTNFYYDPQVRGLLALIALVTAALVAWLCVQGTYGFADSFRYAVFNVVSVITTTGYATTDYLLWGSFPIMVFFFLTYLGACAGSTSGGIKTVRLLITMAAVRKQIRSLIHPHGLFTIKYNGKAVDPPVIQAIIGFLCLYVTANVFLTLALTATGLDFTTAISGAATALANVGPGLGSIIGPAGNFSTLPDSSKWILSLGMLLGRLEIMTVLVLISPNFWKR